MYSHQRWRMAIIDVNKGYEDILDWKERDHWKKSTEPHTILVDLSERDVMWQTWDQPDVCVWSWFFAKWRLHANRIYSARLINYRRRMFDFCFTGYHEQKIWRRLRQSEEKYRSILENIQEAYFEVDLTGTLPFSTIHYVDWQGAPDRIGRCEYSDFRIQKLQKMFPGV